MTRLQKSIYSWILISFLVSSFAAPRLQAAVDLTDVTPRLVSTAGGTEVTFVGTRFISSLTPRINKIPCTDIQFVDASHIVCKSPALPAHEDYDADLFTATGAVADTLPGWIDAAAPVTLTSVTPRDVLADGTTEVTIAGTNFRSETSFKIGTHVFAPYSQTATSATGRAPALAVGESLGLKAAFAQDSLGSFTLQNAVRYIQEEEPPVLTAIEPYYIPAEGGMMITIRGERLAATHKVYLDTGAGTAAVLLSTTFVSSSELRAKAPAHDPGQVQAVLRLGPSSPELSRLSDAAEFVAAWAPCPLEIEATLVDGIAAMRWVNPVAYDAIEVYRNGVIVETLAGSATSFTDDQHIDGVSASYRLVAKRRGGMTAISVLNVAKRICDPPADHGTADTDGSVDLWGMHSAYGEGGGGVAAPAGGKYSSVLIDSASNSAIFNAAQAATMYGAPNELVTGFTLLQQATKIRIEIHGRKLLNGPDLSLRVLLESVTSGVERAVELVMPDVLITPNPEWMELTYNTERPDPDDLTRVDDPLPAADYRVTVYAVGGERWVRHYRISKDASPDQIFVPGIGCPPYPLVRVTDTTGRNSNPQIVSIEQINPPSGSGDALVTTLRANVVDPDGDTIIEYKWKIYISDEWTDPTYLQSSSNTVQATFDEYGYYFAELEVKDNRCGKAKKDVIVVVHPPTNCHTSTQPRFTFPFPAPNRLYFVPDLPGAMDSFIGGPLWKPRVWVVDAGACADGGGTAVTKTVEFAILPPDDYPAPARNLPLALTNGQPAKYRGCLLYIEPEQFIMDCLDDVDMGDPRAARFWEPETDISPNRLPALKYPDGSDVTRYRLMARASRTEDADTNNASLWTAWLPVRVYSGDGQTAIADSEDLHICPKPPYFDCSGNYTTGSYEKDTGKYTFKADSARPGQGGHKFKDTEAVDLEEFGSELPPASSNIDGVQNEVTVSMQEGVWTREGLAGGIQGQIYNGGVTGTKDLDGGGGGGSFGDTGSGGEGFDPLELSYDYCKFETLFDESFETDIFQGIIYTGFIGPVYITISVSISLGMEIGLDTQVEVHLRALDPGNPFEAHFFMTPRAALNLMASIRADAFLGIVSIEGGLTFTTNFLMPFHLGADKNGLLGPDIGFLVTMDLTLWFEACVLWGLFCIPWDIPLLEGEELVREGNPDLVASGCPGGGGGNAGRPSGGSPPIDILSKPDYQLDLACSPSGERIVAVGLFHNGFAPLGYIPRKRGYEFTYPPRSLNLLPMVDPEKRGSQNNPSVVFLDEDTLLLAWTQGFPNEDPDLDGVEDQPPDPDNPGDPVVFNKATRRLEICGITGTWRDDPEKPWIYGIEWSQPFRISGDSSSNLRPDGRVALAPLPGVSSAWAAWVRFETPDMATDDNKVRLNQTSIYVRKIVNGIPSGSKSRISTAGINIEPTISVAPDGTAMVVWVNDPVHSDLMESNLGRNLLVSRYSAGAWSPPSPVLAAPDLYPALLEPSLALKDANYGMIAFTALPQNAQENDLGLYNTRLVYTTKLLNGFWHEPVLIYRKCETPVYAHWPELEVNIELEETPYKPDFMITMQETGPLGMRASSGNILVATFDGAGWNAPINLTPDNRMHEDVHAVVTRAGEIVTINNSPAMVTGEAAGGGGAAGTLFENGLMTQTIAKVADPAISYCRLSDPHAGPGSDVSLKVGVANQGFTGTPVDGMGRGTLVLRVYRLGEDGTKTVVGSRVVPGLSPGREMFFDFDLTMPREPLRLSVEVAPLQGEIDAVNNTRILALGARPPRNVTWRFLRGAEEGEAVVLRWTNGGLYDRVVIYRDGLRIAELPGTATSFVDRGRRHLQGRGLQDRHEYAVRGIAGESKSVRGLATFVKPTAGPEFRRADSNGDGVVDITDPIFTLTFIFLGGQKPGCLKAADADDSGELDITDPVYSLGFLFLGGKAPPAPFPGCGEDPTPDGLACTTLPACP
jgi:hypothetical protein